MGNRVEELGRNGQGDVEGGGKVGRCWGGGGREGRGRLGKRDGGWEGGWDRGCLGER